MGSKFMENNTMTRKFTGFAMALTAALALSGFMATDADARTAAERQAFRAQQRTDRQTIGTINKNLRQRTRQTNAANRVAWRAAGRPHAVGVRAAPAATRPRTRCYTGAHRGLSGNSRRAFRAGVADYRGQARATLGTQIGRCP